MMVACVKLHSFRGLCFKMGGRGGGEVIRNGYVYHTCHFMSTKNIHLVIELDNRISYEESEH